MNKVTEQKYKDLGVLDTDGVCIFTEPEARQYVTRHCLGKQFGCTCPYVTPTWVGDHPEFGELDFRYRKGRKLPAGDYELMCSEEIG